ncbi:MAG TPA: hypothetical protein DDY91_19780 [Planctomycetaceae bacterium]|nr:hypothetical protein [Planctomycetaceae bacterium]
MSRPFTFGNLAISVDGRISTADRALHGFGGAEDRDLMEELRARADAVIIGAATVRDENPRLQVSAEKWRKSRLDADRSPQPRGIVVSRSLDFPWRERALFTESLVRPLVITSADHPASRIADLQHFADVLIVPSSESSLSLSEAMRQLAEMGLHKLLLEGGGELNFAMLAEGLVDEFYLTLCPLVFGGRLSPGAFSGSGFPGTAPVPLELLSIRQGINQRLFLHYRCLNAGPR